MGGVIQVVSPQEISSLVGAEKAESSFAVATEGEEPTLTDGQSEGLLSSALQVQVNVRLVKLQRPRANANLS